MFIVMIVYLLVFGMKFKLVDVVVVEVMFGIYKVVIINVDKEGVEK